ncbi:MAG: Ig-like domain-containing protein, partial [Methanobrevibacter sp.]|nr:Ig-like domain-containing protein [Methanobrevibacter sp.]
RDCNIDDEGNGFINASKLNIGEGRYNLTVSYKGKNLTAPVNLVSNLEINIFDGERIYTTFDEVFAYFSLREGDDEIISSNINGTVNVTIRDANGNVVDTFEQNIYDDGDGDYYVVRSNNDELNGNYTVVIRYFDGNEAATQSEGIVSFKAFDPNDYGASINESVKDVNNRVITFKDVPIMDDNIYVKIDGNITRHFPISEIKEDLETGEVYIKFSQLGELADGQHFISVYIESTEYYYDLTNGTVIVDVVENIDPSLTISIANITEGAAANIVISTNETFTGDVLVKIGDNNYTVSVTNGNGSLPVTGLAVGTHNATAFFKANAFFNESTKNTTFAVNPKVATSVTAPAVTTTYATSKNIAVTLKDANGNPLAGKDVVITLNGASKTVKTNDKGQAVLAIGTKLAPKKYDATFKFAGDSNYLASTGTVKVTVNKAKPKITAKKKTFKAKKKTKKYTIVLKTDKKKPLKNVKVTIKVGKKTYKAKTNKKGKATFKLKKLTKKGKYKATIKFKGNKYYKAVSKKVKITVKK